MTLRIRVAPFGPEASCALRDAVAAAQAGDPLAPVTVVVPRGVTGLGLRRLLASGDLGPAPGATRTGLVNTRFLTLPRLADEVSGPARSGLPVTPAVLRAVAGQVLRQAEDDVFRPVRDHPGAVRALVAAYRDLAGVSERSLEALAGRSRRAAAVVALVRRMGAALADGWYDEGRRLEDAIAALTGERGDDGTASGGAASGGAASGGAASGGAVVVHLPLRLGPRERRFLSALAGHRPVEVIVGATGSPRADTSSRELVEQLVADGAVGAWPEPVTAVPPTGTSVVSAPTADTEVRLAVREVLARRRAGTRFERMAIVHGGTGPYERLVREALAEAGVPCSGVGTRTLATTVAGRTLLGALELVDRGWRRDDVADWLSGAPILGDRGSPVPATAWDLRSREAGITGGLDGWRSHLATYARGRAGELAELEGPEGGDPTPGRVRRVEDQLRQAEALAAFVDRLASDLDVGHGTWRAWATWAEGLLERYLGGPARRQRTWPTEEDEAFTAVRDALGGLAVLDTFTDGVAPDRAAFRQALAAELDVPAPQTSRFGTGVMVGPIGLVVGLPLDAVFVLGMTDGAFPPRSGDDALLPDEERAAAGEDIPLRGRRRHDAEREYLAVLAGASERVLSYPRGDQRLGRDLRPARWLLDTVGALEGKDRRLFSGDLDDPGPIDGFTLVPSFTAALRQLGEPTSLTEWDLRSLLRWLDAERTLRDHFLVKHDPALRTGLGVRWDRRVGEFSRFEGRVDPELVPSPVGAGALSPTSLESYAACPRKYLLGRALRLQDHPRPERILAITPPDRGSLVHEVLERFIRPQLDLPREARIRPGTPWSADDHRRIEELVAEVGAVAEAKGLTGRPLLWSYERATIVRELHRFLSEDDRYRAEGGWVPERVELPFGRSDSDRVGLHLADGRGIEFRGIADRVDRTDGGSLSVLDYKTGSDQSAKGMEEDKFLRGTMLQLPVYGLAAVAALGDGPVRAAYWFVSERGRYLRAGYAVDEPVLDAFRRTVTVLVDGVEAGHFPARPGRVDDRTRGTTGDNCRRCDFGAVCLGNLVRRWGRIKDAPELESFVALVEPQAQA